MRHKGRRRPYQLNITVNEEERTLIARASEASDTQVSDIGRSMLLSWAQGILQGTDDALSEDLKALSARTGISERTLRSRRQHNVKDMLAPEKHYTSSKTMLVTLGNGETLTVKELSERSGIPVHIIRSRIQQGTHPIDRPYRPRA